MPPDEPTTPSNGAPPAEEAPKTLREIAEASWDEVADDGAAPPPDEAGGQRNDGRDNLGRFVAKPGEAEQPPAPSPEDDPNKVTAPSAQQPPDPARTPESNQAPQHWSAEHRETFAKLDPAGQKFLLDRHTEMERDYQQKAQASATAVQFTNALAPIFTDPIVSGSLQEAGVSPFDAIGQWAAMHRRAMDPDPQVRSTLLMEIAQRMGLDPAAVGQASQPGAGVLPEEALKDPAIKFFADHIGKTSTEVQQLRTAMDQMRQADTQRQQTEATRTARWQIDSFADEKGADGKPLHPDFDAVLPAMIEMFRLNPTMDIKQAYEEARWRTPEVRQAIIAQQQQAEAAKAAAAKAKLAQRGNLRGVTSPVSKPASQANGAKKSLRETLEESADEVGL